MTNRRRPTKTQRLRNLALFALVAGGVGFGLSQLAGSRDDSSGADRESKGGNSLTALPNPRPIPRNAPNIPSDAYPPGTGEPLTFERLALIDPQAAARGIAGLPDGEERDEKLMILLATWADTDPESAANWASDLPMGSFRVEALARVAALWTDRDREAMKRWLELQQPPSHFLPAWGAFAMGWAAVDPEAAVNWSMRIQDDEARLRAESGIARQLAATNPDFAQEWLSTVTDVKRFDLLGTQFVTAWSGEDPVATARWLDGGLVLQNEAFHRKAALILASQWTAADPPAAGEWINQLQDGSLRENAKFAFAQSIAGAEPEIALAWADAIDDEADRRETILGIYEQWLTNDPDAFKTALIERWPKEGDPAMRQEIYEILYSADESFRKEVFSLLEGYIYPEDPNAPVEKADSTPPEGAPATEPAASLFP